MTVNERLFEAGLLDDFDVASKNREQKAMIDILLRVELNESQAKETSDAIIDNPSKYGY